MSNERSVLLQYNIYSKAVNRTVLACPGRNNYLSLLENT